MMDVFELEGAELDYWVAKAEGQRCRVQRCFGGVVKRSAERKDCITNIEDLETVWYDEDRCVRVYDALDGVHEEGGFWLGYTTRWELCGPIIDRENICVYKDRYAVLVGTGEWVACIGLEAKEGEYWGEETGSDPAELSGKFMQVGATPLIAAMRTYVASKYGEYNLPDPCP